jgi:hypothetical protein
MNESFKRFWENQFVPLGILLAGGLIIVGIIAAGTAIAIKNANNTLSVTGSATTDVTADTAKWTVTAQRFTSETGVGMATTQVGSDAAKVVAYLKAAGVTDDQITLGTVHTDQDYSYSQDANAPKRYAIREDITVSSKDPAAVQKLAQGITALANQGVLLSVSDPQYYVSTLPDIRVSLVGKAVEDAKARAEQIADSTGQSVGRLQSASTGVVQVLAPNSTDVSDYGSYDTSTIDKTVSVTVRATFFVR